jgi:RNA polymerase sigma-70 factor (ECF subfamily)
MADAFERLFLTEYKRVVTIAKKILQDANAAEDVAQEVFLAFHRNHSALAEFGPVWLHRAALHSAINEVRKRKRRARYEQAGIDPQPHAPDAEVSVLEEDERRQVREALARLPRRSAEVLALRHSGLTYEQTAAALGVKTDQIGTMLRRAEARLRKEVAE